MHEIVSFKEFEKSCEKLLGEDQQVVIENLVGSNPKVGALYEGTGGIRKLPWPQSTDHKNDIKGTVYYFYKDRSLPLYLISVFKPGAKQTLAKTIEIMVAR